MEIIPQQINSHINKTELPTQLREGDVYHAKIESRVSEREAVISVRGQIVNAQFSGKVPDQNVFTVKMEGTTKDGIQVSVVERSPEEKITQPSSRIQAESSSQNITHREASPELKAAVQRFNENGIPLTKESLKELQRFLSQGQGKLQERIETVNVLVKKGLEPTADHLRTVHEALNGKTVTNMIRTAVQEKTNEAPLINEKVIEQINALVVKRAGQLDMQQDQKIQPSNDVRELLQQFGRFVSHEPDLLHALQKIQKQLDQTILPKELEHLLKQGIQQATEVLGQGRELKGRKIITGAIQASLEKLPAHTSPLSMNGAKQELLSTIAENLQTGLGPAKDILVTQVTERLAFITDEFKDFQRETSRQLGRITLLIDQFKMQSPQQVKPMLETVIKQLDRALLKQDWLLYTDMKTEKNVLEASSRLAEAKSLLGKGEHQQAQQIVREVQQTLDRILFKPTSQKVMHIVSNEVEWKTPRTPIHRLTHQLENTARTFTNHEGSPRQVFEGLRMIGLTRESDIAQQFASSRNAQQDGEHQRNIKSLLMEVARGEREGSTQQQQAQQALNNITGQQLMSRTDHQQNMQMLMFQLPILLKGQAENLQIYVNSRNEGEKVDWENCNIFFLIETKKMGEVGISLSVTERTLSVTLKNDDPSFKNKVEPIAEKYLERLKEVGFHVHGLKFSKMKPNEELKTNPNQKSFSNEALSPTLTKKGFDYKI